MTMQADQQARDLFAAFRELNPNSAEGYNPTFANMQRWLWHVNEAKFRPKYEKMVPGQILGEDVRLASARRFMAFRAMPKYMRDRFRQLAGLFQGREVWAVGSRVTGEWCEADSLSMVLKMREGLGKAPKLESDYDIWTEPQPGDDMDEMRARIPVWGDLLPHGVPPDQKILIPMWDFTRLPREEHAEVLRLYAAQRWGALMAMHNKYRLSPDNLCCNEAPAREWFKWAVDNKIIQPCEVQSSR